MRTSVHIPRACVRQTSVISAHLWCNGREKWGNPWKLMWQNIQWGTTKETLSQTRWKARWWVPMDVLWPSQHTHTHMIYFKECLKMLTSSCLNRITFHFHLPDVVYIFKHFKYLFSYICVHTSCYEAHVEVRGQLVRVGSLLLCVMWVLAIELRSSSLASRTFTHWTHL